MLAKQANWAALLEPVEALRHGSWPKVALIDFESPKADWCTGAGGKWLLIDFEFFAGALNRQR